jgi:hypothetical protein
VWSIDKHPDVERRFKKLRKSRRRELKNVFDNLDTFLEGLKSGIHPETLKKDLAFVHGNYPLGIVSIDQSGPTEGKGKLVQLRLYAYPSIQEEVLYLRTLGEKDSQERDVATAREFVEGLLKGLEGNKPSQRTEDNDQEEQQG